MPAYTSDVIYAPGNVVIHLKFVESFIFDQEENEDAVIDKLKNNYTFTVRTVSGKEYNISTDYVRVCAGIVGTPTEIATCIYEKWFWIHKS